MQGAKSRRGRGTLIIVSICALSILALWSTLSTRHSTHAREERTSVASSPTLKGSKRDEVVHAASSHTALVGGGTECATLQVTVRDLADGSTVAGVRVTAGGEELVSTADGVLCVPVPAIGEIRSDSALWKLPPHSAVQLAEDSTLWMYRMRTVLGVVKSWDARVELSFQDILLEARLVGDPDSTATTRSPLPWTEGWAREHGDALRVLRLGHVVEADGKFTVSLPCIRGIVLRAEAPGWAPDWRDVPAEDQLESSPEGVVLTLKKTILVRGVLRNALGEPVSGALVELYITVRGARDLNIERLGLHGGGLVSAVTDRTSEVSVISEARTNEAGSFSLRGRLAGDAVVVAHAKGYKPARSAMGVVEGDVSSLQLTASSARRRVVRFVNGAEHSLAGWRLSVVDMTDASKYRNLPQISFAVTLDSDGRIAADWFESGRRYALLFRPPDSVRSGTGLLKKLIVWQEAAQVDISELGFELGY